MKTHREYIDEQIKKNPRFAEDLAAATRDVAIAVELARLREHRSLSQTTVARLTGMKQSQVARLESGVHLPSLPTLLKLLAVLGGKLELGPHQCRITATAGKVTGLRVSASGTERVGAHIYGGGEGRREGLGRRRQLA